jgi:hypothetical protein
MAIDDTDNVQFCCDIPQCRQGAELKDPSFDRPAVCFLKAPEQSVCCSQMHEHDGPRFPIDPTRFDNLPVRMSTRDFLLYGSHDISVYKWAHFVKKNFENLST